MNGWIINENMQLKVLKLPFLRKCSTKSLIFFHLKMSDKTYILLNLITIFFVKKGHFQSAKMNCFLSTKQIQVKVFFLFKNSLSAIKV